MNDRTVAFAILLLLAPLANAGLPEFDTDQAADEWLRNNSAFYAQMAAAVAARGGYSFRGFPGGRGGMLRIEKGIHVIELSDTLTGAERVSILVFEMTNAFQQPKHDRIDRRVIDGKITDPEHFAILHELVEYDGLHLHWRVLRELKARIGGIPAAMVAWITTPPRPFESYAAPAVTEYIEAQAASGHTEHYRQWFWKQKAVRDQQQGQ